MTLVNRSSSQFCLYYRTLQFLPWLRCVMNITSMKREKLIQLYRVMTHVYSRGRKYWAGRNLHLGGIGYNGEEHH